MYNLLFSENIEQLNIEEEIREAFPLIARLSGSNCGVLILKSKTSDSFMEYASFGYGEEGFFYNFMARGKGVFEKVSETNLPSVFLARDYEMYRDYTDYAVVSRIASGKEILGFLLVEFTGEYNELFPVFFGLVANRIASLWKTGFGNKPETYYFENQGNTIFEILLESSLEFQKQYEKKKDRNLLLINGHSGTGKKSFARFLHRNKGSQGDIIFLNTIPEQLVKLEKSLLDWCSMVGQGLLVFENVGNFQLGQQRLFFEFLQEKELDCSLYFLNTLSEPVEVYGPFWRILGENTLTIPGLSSVDKDLLRRIILQMFNEICVSRGRGNLNISNSALDFLCEHYYSENLKELRNILEYSILKVKGDSLLKDDLIPGQDKGSMPIGTQDAEDLNLRRCVDALERQKILLANKLFAGNQVRMAKALGISRGSLQYKMKQMEL
ncbi:MAG: hypothetical protein H7A25_20345 [Leptospiraceae bacterium]|nr:hypothetical protein [Leptospiraceae bacterium]